MREHSTKPNTFYQLKGYPGLENMAPYIAEYFPNNIQHYVEPFAGLGRTVEFLYPETTMILNDKSPQSTFYLKAKFPKAVVTSYDFDYVMRYYINREDMFMFIDPPWRKNIYKNNDGPICDRTPIEYYETIFGILKEAKFDWILTSDIDEHEIGKRVSKSGYPNLVLKHPTKKFFGRSVGVRMCSNKPLIKHRSIINGNNI